MEEHNEKRYDSEILEDKNFGKYIFLISYPNGILRTGFFIEFFVPNKLDRIKVLLTTYINLGEKDLEEKDLEKGVEIKVFSNDDKVNGKIIKKEDCKIIFQNEIINATMIEIFNDADILNNIRFLKFFEEYEDYSKKSVFLADFSPDKKLIYPVGLIIQKEEGKMGEDDQNENETKIEYFCFYKGKSFGGPILLDNKVLGIHYGNNNQEGKYWNSGIHILNIIRCYYGKNGLCFISKKKKEENNNNDNQINNNNQNNNINNQKMGHNIVYFPNPNQTPKNNKNSIQNNINSPQMKMNNNNFSQNTNYTSNNKIPLNQNIDKMQNSNNMNYPQNNVNYSTNNMNLFQNNTSYHQNNMAPGENIVNKGLENMNQGYNNKVPEKPNMNKGQDNVFPEQPNMALIQNNMNQAQNNMIPQQTKMNPGQNNMNQVQNNIIQNQNNIVQVHNNMGPNQNNIIQVPNNMIQRQTNMIDGQNNMVPEQNNMPASKTNMISNQNNMIQNQTNMAQNQTNMVQNQTNMVQKQNNQGQHNVNPRININNPNYINSMNQDQNRYNNQFNNYNYNNMNNHISQNQNSSPIINSMSIQNNSNNMPNNYNNMNNNNIKTNNNFNYINSNSNINVGYSANLINNINDNSMNAMSNQKCPKENINYMNNNTNSINNNNINIPAKNNMILEQNNMIQGQNNNIINNQNQNISSIQNENILSKKDIIDNNKNMETKKSDIINNEINQNQINASNDKNKNQIIENNIKNKNDNNINIINEINTNNEKKEFKDIYPNIEVEKLNINFIMLNGKEKQCYKIPSNLSGKEIYYIAYNLCEDNKDEFEYKKALKLYYNASILKNDDTIQKLKDDDEIVIAPCPINSCLKFDNLKKNKKSQKIMHFNFSDTKADLPGDIKDKEIQDYISSIYNKLFGNRITCELYFNNKLYVSKNLKIESINAFTKLKNININIRVKNIVSLQKKPGAILNVQIQANKKLISEISVGTFEKIKDFYEDLKKELIKKKYGNYIPSFKFDGKTINLKENDDRTFLSINIRKNFICFISPPPPVKKRK